MEDDYRQRAMLPCLWDHSPKINKLFKSAAPTPWLCRVNVDND